MRLAESGTYFLGADIEHLTPTGLDNTYPRPSLVADHDLVAIVQPINLEEGVSARHYRTAGSQSDLFFLYEKSSTKKCGVIFGQMQIAKTNRFLIYAMHHQLIDDPIS